MSHIHNYEELLASTRLALKNWRTSEEMNAVTLTDDLIASLLLDFLLETLGIKIEDPIPFDPESLA